MRTMKYSLFLAALILCTMSGQAATLKSTIITYTFDDGRTLSVPAEHMVDGTMTESQQQMLKAEVNKDPVHYVGKQIDRSTPFGQAFTMGQVALKSMNDAVLAAQDKGQQAMVDAANGVFVQKNKGGTETLFDFGGAVLDGLKEAFGLNQQKPFNPAKPIQDAGHFLQGFTQDVNAGKYDAQLKAAGDFIGTMK